MQLDPNNEEAQQYLAALRGTPAPGVTPVRYEEAATAVPGQ